MGAFIDGAHADELVSRANGKPKRDALANDVAFSSNCFDFFAGLGDMITRNEEAAWRVAHRLEAGMIVVNNYIRRSFLGSPFSGVKGSGFGWENAPETLHEFARSKAVLLRSGRGEVPVWPPRA